MKQKTLRAIWMTIALLVFVFVFNMHAATQGAGLSIALAALPIQFEFSEDTSTVAYALHGLRGIVLVFWVVPFLAWAHARREAGSAAAAFPFRLLDITPSSKPGIFIQTIAFLLLIVAPFLSARHFWDILTERGHVCRSDPTLSCEDIWSRPAQSGGLWDHTYRLTDGATNNGPTYEPVIEPTLTLIMIGIAAVFSFLLMIEMLRARRRSAPLRKGKAMHREVA